MRGTPSWQSIYYSGWGVLCLGIVNMIWDFSTRVDRYHFDIGLVWANIAFILMGLFAIEIARFLRGLKSRLDQLEERTQQRTHDV